MKSVINMVATSQDSTGTIVLSNFRTERYQTVELLNDTKEPIKVAGSYNNGCNATTNYLSFLVLEVGDTARAVFMSGFFSDLTVITADGEVSLYHVDTFIGDKRAYYYKKASPSVITDDSKAFEILGEEPESFYTYYLHSSAVNENDYVVRVDGTLYHCTSYKQAMALLK